MTGRFDGTSSFTFLPVMFLYFVPFFVIFAQRFFAVNGKRNQEYGIQ